MTSSPKKRYLMMRALVFLFSLTVCLVASEVVIRLLDLAPEIYVVETGRFQHSRNPLIGYELVPYFESDTSGPLLDFKGKANSLGFRDREHAIEKKRGVFRILVLGDSITQGLRIQNSSDIFTSVLERQMNTEKTNDVEVINFGVNGYNTQQEVEILREKGLSFSPDLVILSYCVNDTDFVAAGIIYNLEKKIKHSRILLRKPKILMKSDLFRLLYSSNFSRYSVQPDKFHAIKKNTVFKYLNILGEISRNNGFKVLVVWFPRLDGFINTHLRNQLDQVKRISASHGFHFLDLTESLATCAKDRSIAIDMMHPSRWGHHCAGKAIANYIKIEVISPGI